MCNKLLLIRNHISNFCNSIFFNRTWFDNMLLLERLLRKSESLLLLNIVYICTLYV